MSKKYARQKQSQPKHSHYSSVQPILSVPKVPTSFSSRPEWRGTGYQKPKKKAPTKVVSKSEREKELEILSPISLELQQKLLDVIRNTFPMCMEDYEVLKPLLVAVKTQLDVGGLKGREFEKKEMKEAYLARWVPERLLVLAALLADWAENTFPEEPVFETVRLKDSPLNVVSFGNGAAEVLAISALLRQIRPNTAGVAGTAEVANPQSAGGTKPHLPISLRIMHGPTTWAAEIDSLLTAVFTPPVLSNYASAAAKAAARPFLARDAIALHYHAEHIPENDLESKELADLVGKTSCLITFCFSLKEMQAISATKTIKFLISLTQAAPKGSLILVVDEIERSDVEVLEDGEKNYPLRFLLDLALLGKGVLREKAEVDDNDDESAGPESAWERLVVDEERVFKIDPSLDYPLSLGKVRVQAHLFRRR